MGTTTRSLPVVLLALLVGSPAVQAQSHNYSEALQKSLFFYEVQTSGFVAEDHRAEWRGDSCTRDGADVGRDLAGGWYDAGDGVVWTGNDGFGASLLAWSLIKQREVFIGTGQYHIAIDRVREISAYLEKIVQLDGSGNIEQIYCGKGAIKDAPPDNPAPDNDRTEGCPNEVMDAVVGGSPQALRPSFWVDSSTGGADVAGAVAAALAANSIALREFGDTTRAEQLLALAKKAFAWGEANPNLALTIGGTNTSLATRRMANGLPVTIADYANRTAAWTPRMLYAAAWLHRADTAAGTPGYTQGWIDKAELIYNSGANGPSRLKHWVNFASGSEQNGAYAMMAADSGRPAFVTEANNYAKFWLYDRSNHTGLTTDPTVTPEGFVCRGQGASWNVHALLDQAPPLLDWADSPYNTNATRKQHLIALFTGSYNNGNNECPVKQIDYILGSNSRKLSYLQGYKPAGTGYDWVKNLHHRPTMWAYGGFGTVASDKPAWNRFTAYGTLCPGPDKTDFYPVTKTLTDTLEIAYQEPIIYSGGILTVLARNIAAGGPSAGAPLPTFPEWETRSTGYQTEAFFVRAVKDSTTRFQCGINNRATLPPREISTLGFRYYFTPDGVAGSSVSCTATGLGLLSGESVAVAGPYQVGSSGVWFFEIRLVNAMIVPGEYKRYQRKVQLDFAQPSGTFNAANDHSGVAITSTESTIANIPVYDTADGSGWKLLGGFEPSAGNIQWRRAHFNNVMESASSVVLIAERVGGTAGVVSATVTCANGTATAADYTAPTGSAATLSWADGEKGEKTISIPLTADSFKEGREYFTAALGTFTGSASAGITTDARVSIEDDDFNGSTDPGSLVQVFGNNTSIADNDTTPSASDHSHFGEATTATETVTRTFTLTNLDSTPLTLNGSPLVTVSGSQAADFTVITAPAGSVAASGSTTFQIRFAPSANGDRTATVTIANTKSTDGTFSFAIKGKGVGAKPSGSISPTSVNKELRPGGSTAGSANQTITLANTGRADLPWTASLPAAYTAKTSTSANGPAYRWIDITTAGASQGSVITLWKDYSSTVTVGSNQNRDDHISTAITIGFNFPYYGSNRTEIIIGSNGFITFDTTVNGTSYSNYALPSTALKAPSIAPWWDDLYLKANQGDIYYKRVDADTFVVTWHRVSYYNNGSPSGDMSFQVLLKRNGQIICQYKNVMSPVDSDGYTLGIQNSTSAAAQAVQYAYNTKTAENGIAIEFRPPPQGSHDVTGTTSDWATLDTTSAIANAQSSSSVGLSLNTTGLTSGQTYPTEITLSTPGDTAHTSYAIPVILTAKQFFSLAASGTSNRAWETTSNWSAPTSAFPGPSDDLVLNTAGGSLRIDGPRTINAFTLDASAGLVLTGTGFGGSGTGATLTTTGLVTILQGDLLVGGSNAKLQLIGGLALSGGSFGFASGSTGAITIADGAPLTLSGGILDALINTSSTIYRQSLGTGDLTLSGPATQIRVGEDTFTLARRLTGQGGFRKTGAGTLVLVGTGGDHSGATDIGGGTLRLGTNGAVGGASLLRLSGGTLDLSGLPHSVAALELTGASTITLGGGSLVIGHSAGIPWSGSSLVIAGTGSVRFGTSNASLTPAQLAKVTLNGSSVALDAFGQMFATTGLSTLDVWRQTHFATRGQTGFASNNADPDGDGSANLVEFALGTSPNDATDCARPTLSVSGTHAVLTFTPQRLEGLRYIIEASADMSDWSEVTDITSSLQPGVEYTHTDSTNQHSTPHRFVRLRLISL